MANLLNISAMAVEDGTELHGVVMAVVTAIDSAGGMTITAKEAQMVEWSRRNCQNLDELEGIDLLFQQVRKKGIRGGFTPNKPLRARLQAYMTADTDPQPRPSAPPTITFRWTRKAHKQRPPIADKAASGLSRQEP